MRNPNANTRRGLSRRRFLERSSAALAAGAGALSTRAPAAETPRDLSMPELPAHPRLLLSDADIPHILKRANHAEFAQARLDTLLRSAKARLGRKVELPPRGGQWFHWYACKKDGANLQTVSPAEHRCPACGAVYSGWPYDDVVLMRAHDGYSKAIRELGLAYRLTSEPKYADQARAILLAYAGRYLHYPLHDIHGHARKGGGRVGPQTLDEAVWLIGVCQGADLIWDRLTPSEQSQIETGLLRPAAETIRQHKMGIHNIQCWKNSAVGLVGLLLDDRELVADAVSSEHGFRQQIAQGVNADGQWYEGAWGYHFYTMSALAPLAEAGERCGLNLYGYEHEGRNFRRLFEAPLALAMPTLELPAFNDSAPVRLTSQHGLYELALARYGDRAFAALLRRVKRDSLEALLAGVVPLPPAPVRASGSRNFPAAGYAVLEDGEGQAASWLCLKYGPHGGGHGHPDKLSFVFYSDGAVLGCDPGTGKYGVPLHEGWQKTSIAHNTLTIDEANQQPATGTCLAFARKARQTIALADAGPICPGVSYRRAVALVGAHTVLVLDRVDADRDHTFDFAYHEAGAWSTAPRGEAVAMPDKPGYRYLEGMVRVNGPLPPIVRAGLPVNLAVAAAEGRETWAGTGPASTTSERVPCVVLRVKGRTAIAAWAIHLGQATPSVRVARMGADWTAEVKIAGQTYRLSVGAEGTVKVTFETSEAAGATRRAAATGSAPAGPA